MRYTNDRFRRSLLLFMMPALIALSSIVSCRSSSELSNPGTSATLWVQNAAEYQAIATMTYQTAISNLGLALNDSYWTADLRQNDQGLPQKKPAVILDVDETVLNNAPFQARMIKKGTDYNPKAWNRWVMEANASAISGSIAFTKKAAEKDIAVFYVTNREAKVEKGTRQNLEKLGYPLSEDEDRILSKNEKSDWTSSKLGRRKYVADRYRILMLFGDNLNDFFPAKDITQEQRSALVKKYRNNWGRKWYMLPNPTYGSWESALYDFDSSLSASQIDSARKANLNTKK